MNLERSTCSEMEQDSIACLPEVRVSHHVHEWSRMTAGKGMDSPANGETDFQMFAVALDDDVSSLSRCGGTGQRTACSPTSVSFEQQCGRHESDSSNSNLPGTPHYEHQQGSGNWAIDSLPCLVTVFTQACEAWAEFWHGPFGWMARTTPKAMVSHPTLLRSSQEGNLDLLKLQSGGSNMIGHQNKEFEPLNFSDGASCVDQMACDYAWRFSSEEGLMDGPERYSWTAGQQDFGAAAGHLMNSEGKPSHVIYPIPNKQVKCVTFSEAIEVHLYQDHRHINFRVDACSAEDTLRQFWHLDGQIRAWSSIYFALSSLHGNGGIQTLQIEDDSSRGQISGVVNQRIGQMSNHALWWSDVLHRHASTQSRQPTFIVTWFLSVETAHLCVQSRRIKADNAMSFERFQEDCKSAWHELLDGRQIQLYEVDGEVAGLPSSVAHVLIIQGDHELYNAVLVEGQQFPPLFRTRAVLFPRETNVADFFRIAQFPGTCHRQQFLCMVSFQEHEGSRTLTTLDGMDVPIAKFVKGCMRFLEEDEPTDGEQESDASTVEPFSDVDASEVNSAQSDEEQDFSPIVRPTWCSDAIDGSGSEDSSSSSAWAEDQVGEIFAQHNGGDEFSLMSSTPITCFHDPPHSHAWDLDEEQA